MIAHAAVLLIASFFLLFLLTASTVNALSIADFHSAVHHWSFGNHLVAANLEDLANQRIPRRDGGQILAYQAPASSPNRPFLVLLHEFYGLAPSICEKADALALELDCTVVCPDTFRGDSSTFIPKCIWLALSTPQERVNNDLDDVVQYLKEEFFLLLGGIMGLCYGGGKALRYTCQ